MKIQGIAGAKHPSLKKGDAIPLSPDKKVISAAREEVVKSSPEGHRFLPTEAKVLGEVNVMTGRVSRTKTDAAQYRADVEVKYRSLRLSDDTLFPVKVAKVRIHCEDTTNEIGVPDLKILSFEVLDS